MPKGKKKAKAERFENDIAPTQNNMGNWGGIGIGGGSNGPGFPFNQGNPYTTQVSNVNTGFVNLRWYLISNLRQFLSELYVEISLIKTIVDTPVDDGLRGGIKVKSKQLDEDQIETLLASLDRDDEINQAGQAEKWNRLFGGAGILILTDQDPEEPLDMESIGPDTALEFRAVDMWELFWDKQNTEGYDPAVQAEDFEFYNYYGEFVHKSRVMRLKGLSAPSFIRPRLRGWGFSVVEGIIRSLNQYLKTTDLIFEVLDEFKVDVYKIKNLVNTLLSPQGSQQIQERIQKSNYLKNYQNALVMDAEDDWDHKQLSFAGLAETQEQNRIQFAADARFPINKLFGTSATGFASGQDSIEIYNSMVESEVRNKLKYPLLRICEIKCQKLFGFVPTDLSITFEPLRILSAVDEESVKTAQFTRLLQARQAQEISGEEFRDGCNHDHLLGIVLEDLPNDWSGYMSDSAKEGIHDPYETKDIDDPGADRLDTRKSRATEVGGATKDLKEAPPPRSPTAPISKALVTEEPPKPLKRANSAKFDKASYEADGGDRTFDMRRKYFYENPLDAGLWDMAKQTSMEAFGKEHLPFMVWKYEKIGGQFNEDTKKGA